MNCLRFFFFDSPFYLIPKLTPNVSVLKAPSVKI